MNKFVLMSILPIVFSCNVIACSGGVDMTVPHIHDVDDFLVSVEKAKNNKLKEIDIYQVFAGKLEKEMDETHLIAKEGKSNHSHQQVN
jgi:hypothetical protein